MSGTIFALTLDTLGKGLIYMALALATLRLLPTGVLREASFAVVTCSGFYAIFFHSGSGVDLLDLGGFGGFAIYLVFGVLHWWVLQRCILHHAQPRWGYYIALAVPLVPLVLVKIETAWHLVGFSYMAFRMVQAAMELQKAREETCAFWSYLGFLYFPLTVALGPINPYLNHKRSLVRASYDWDAALYGLGRIAIGLVKLRLLSILAYQLTFSNLWLDGFEHGYADFLTSCLAYLVYMYFNFSGACDIVIGAAGILNIRIKENFDSPFIASNIRDYWNRWHISLSELVRDLVFTPVFLNGTRALGATWALPASMIAAMLTFTIIGLWHGFTSGFLLFGLWHGAGFCIHILWDHALSKCSRETRKAIRLNTMYRAGSTILTILFVALSMYFFALPTLEQREAIWSVHTYKW